jgi:hypothetical protein
MRRLIVLGPGRTVATLVGVVLIASACRDSGTTTSGTSKAASPEPTTPGQVERSISLTAGGNVALLGEAAATVRTRVGTGSVTLRISRVGTPSQSVGGAPWLQQVGNLIRLEAEGGALPSSVDLQLKLLKDRLPQGIDEEHIFAARVQNGVIRPQPTRVNLRGLSATVAVTEPGTFAAFAVRTADLTGAIRELWGSPGAATASMAGGCPVPAGALAGGCRRPSPDGEPRRALVEAVNPQTFYLELVFARGDGVSGVPRDGAATCGNGVVVPPGGRASWLVNPSDDEVIEGTMALSAAPSPCAQFVQVVSALLGPALGLDTVALPRVAATWYDQVSGTKLLRSATKSWEEGNRAGWAADTITFLINPARLDALIDAMGEAGATAGEVTLREQAFAAGDVIDAIGSVRGMVAAPSPAADGSGGPAPLEFTFRFPPHPDTGH